MVESLRRIHPVWKTLGGVLIGIGTALGALQSMGWAMPWNSLSRQEAAQTYETKESANLHYQEIEQLHQQALIDISTKLDTLIKTRR